METDKYNLANKTVLVYDFGNQVAIAQRLAQDFGRVLLYIPSVINGYKDHKPHGIGRGIAGVERVDDWWQFYHTIDLFVFTDIYLGGLQDFLRSQGKLVFGSGLAGSLETDRVSFKELLRSLDLPVNDYEVAYGIGDLDNKLSQVEDRYIKSSLRGDMETWHHQNHTLSKPKLAKMRHDMGVYGKNEIYLIESPIEAIGEIGLDTYCVMGQYPRESSCCLEIKDTCAISKIIRYAELPKQLTQSADKIAPVLQAYDYRAAFSTEVRVTKEKKGYFIDPCVRFPEPNTALTLEQYENYSEVIYEVAMGIVPMIKYKYRWGCQLIGKSELARTEPVAIEFPAIYCNNVKIKNLVIDEMGTHWFTPNGSDMKEILAVVGLGHSMDQAVKMATEIAETVKGFDLKIDTDECIEEARETIEKLNKNGIRFL